jgi:hypothetical protein
VALSTLENRLRQDNVDSDVHNAVCINNNQKITIEQFSMRVLPASTMHRFVLDFPASADVKLRNEYIIECRVCITNLAQCGLSSFHLSMLFDQRMNKQLREGHLFELQVIKCKDNISAIYQKHSFLKIDVG